LDQESNLSEFRILTSEQELKDLLDLLYDKTKTTIEQGEQPRFKGLLEYMKSEITILTAIHNIKSNKGSETPGSDGETMREHILEKDYIDIITRVQSSLTQYKPSPIRRKYIPKPGKAEKRPLGIPTIIDRIVQECVRMILEPIMEAQFFKHSYGFRPMRDAHMALERMSRIIHATGYHWIVEGDIRAFFDCVNHTKLCRLIYSMGVHDQRVLMIIKAMVKAGIMNEIQTNPLGTPQGGIISPLLANIYLHQLDQWITREWENKKTQTAYVHIRSKTNALKRRSHLKPAYLVRYADDWILITDTKQNAEKWKQRIAKYVRSNLNLTLSEEKTFITNVREKPIHFLGCQFKVVKGRSRTGYITRTMPDNARLKAKVKDIHRKMDSLKNCGNKEKLMHEIYNINAIIRGLIQYYQCTTWVHIVLRKYSRNLELKAMSILRKYNGTWIPANKTHNLSSIHSNYTQKIPTIVIKGMYIGVTSLNFCKWKETKIKKPDETPYTEEGRQIYLIRTGKRPRKVRADKTLATHLTNKINDEKCRKQHNFEYLLNRAYAFNRDKGKCRVCGKDIQRLHLDIHHIDPYLPLGKVNQVNNLASVHDYCHQIIHSEQDHSALGKKCWTKILKFREKLNRFK
jgi:RNA-directed DNA polymerase